MLDGVNGLIGGFLTLCFCLGVAQILDLKGFPQGFAICFALAFPLYVGSALAVRRLVELPQLQRPGRSGSAFPWAAM